MLQFNCWLKKKGRTSPSMTVSVATKLNPDKVLLTFTADDSDERKRAALLSRAGAGTGEYVRDDVGSVSVELIPAGTSKYPPP
jgi:hypothetical protein